MIKKGDLSNLVLINLFNLFGMTRSLLPVFAIAELKMSAKDYGLAIAFGNIGPVLGAVINSHLKNKINTKTILFLGSLLAGFGLFLFPFATEKKALLWVSLPLAISGLGASLFNINQLSIRQKITPLPLLGRMNATFRFFIWGSIPVGAYLGGALGESIGLRETFVVAAVGSILGVIPLISLLKIKAIDNEQYC